MGENVRISTVAVVPDTQVTVEEEQRRLIIVQGGATVGELARALNAMGVSPRDLIATFQAIKAAGALHATLEIF